MGFAHDRHDGDSAGGADGFLAEKGEEFGFVFGGDGGENVGDAGYAGEFVFAGGLGFEVGEVEGGLGVVGAGEGLDDVGDGQCVVRVGRDGIVIVVVSGGQLLILLFLFVEFLLFAFVRVVDFHDAGIVVVVGWIGVAIGSHCFRGSWWLDL